MSSTLTISHPTMPIAVSASQPVVESNVAFEASSDDAFLAESYPFDDEAESGAEAEVSQTADHTIIFKEDGDLYLEISGEKCSLNGDLKTVTCVVSSGLLANASRVFQRMLFGGFKEAKPISGPWIIKLPDDWPNAMIVLLNIVHGYNSKVPVDLRWIDFSHRRH